MKAAKAAMKSAKAMKAATAAAKATTAMKAMKTMKAQPMKAMKAKAKCPEEEAESMRNRAINRAISEILRQARWQAWREVARAIG